MEILCKKTVNAHEKSPETISRQCEQLIKTTGYDEVSLSSLSTSDHSGIEEILNRLTDYTDKENINLALPSMRIDRFSDELLQKINAIEGDFVIRFMSSHPKDAGKKLCAINKIEQNTLFHPVIDKLLSGPDKDI